MCDNSLDADSLRWLVSVLGIITDVKIPITTITKINSSIEKAFFILSCP